MEKQSTESSSSSMKGSLVNSHKDAINQISEEFNIAPTKVDGLVRFFFTRLLNIVMTSKRNIYLHGFGRFTYKGMSKAKLERLQELKNKPRKIIKKL